MERFTVSGFEGPGFCRVQWMEGFTVVWFLVLGFEFFYMERFTVFWLLGLGLGFCRVQWMQRFMVSGF